MSGPFCSQQYDLRDRARRFRLELGEALIHTRLFGREPISFRAFEHDGPGGKALCSDFDGDIRVCYQVVIPVWMGWPACVRAKHQQAAAIGKIGIRGEQQQRGVRELAAYLAPMCMKLFDNGAIPLAPALCHPHASLSLGLRRCWDLPVKRQLEGLIPKRSELAC